MAWSAAYHRMIPNHRAIVLTPPLLPAVAEVQAMTTADLATWHAVYRERARATGLVPYRPGRAGREVLEAQLAYGHPATARPVLLTLTRFGGETVRGLHDAAMQLAEWRWLVRRGWVDRPDQAETPPPEAVQELAWCAFELEAAAAWQVPGGPAAEPTRSVLHRSAAWLALECGVPMAAQVFAAQGLAGSPPPEIAAELREVAAAAAAATLPTARGARTHEEKRR